MTIYKTLTCSINKDSATIVVTKDSLYDISICVDGNDKESTDYFGTAYLTLPEDVAKELARSILSMIACGIGEGV